ncbi:MAG TPA: ATP-binding protein [Abditibacteriaceae bacterium]|jgi:PAS domain S-box-containing protein
MSNKRQVWQELVNPLSAYERQTLMDAGLGIKQPRQKVKQQVRQLMETITDAFCALNHEWRFLYLNDQCECYYGRCRGELLGKVLWDECPALCGSTFEAECRRAMSEHAAVHFEIFSSGSLRWLEIHAFPTPEGLAVYLRDITSRKSAEAKREQMLHDAQEDSRHQDEFLATVSHELRTPLSAVVGWVSLLRSGVLSQADQTRALETIERSARAQAQLIEDILDISRVATGKLRLETAMVSLVDVLQVAIDMVRPAAEAKGVRLSLEPNTTENVPGDLSRLQQVFWNLLSNAVKFTPRGGEVRVTLLPWGDEVLVTITDTGQGIALEFLPLIFERFQQTDNTSTRSQDGLGLGLAIVRQLVELHEGWVWADSAGLGKGATFTVSLPRAVASQVKPAHDESPESLVVFDKSTLHATSLAGARVLVVDDEADARDLVTTLLQAQGAQVMSAPSAGEALITFARAHPKVLVFDIDMPGGDGYKLIAGVRALEAAQGDVPVPAVALTSYARAEDRERALQAGFQHHLAKPFDPAELVRAVATSQVLSTGVLSTEAGGERG